MTEAERFLEEKLRRGAQTRETAARPSGMSGKAVGGAVARAGWFTTEGRLNRMGYFLRMLCVFPVALVGSVLCDQVPALGIPLLGATVVVNALQGVKRLHDLGQSGWLILLCLVPIVNVGVGLWLLFGSGDKGVNRYGASQD
ncbi:MAG: DUF805 domain-containing protein [Kiritimatiellae bacterium]|nr:DUF805 domain-containing protein [Kiritimatiellia bacterium]